MHDALRTERVSALCAKYEFGASHDDGDAANPKPRVSVVLPTHRLDEYLQPAIQSILRQTFSNLELLLVLNEKLRDRQKEILAYCNGDARVRLLEAPALGGLSLALNLGIAAARSEYIARMDGDDISLPCRLEKQVQYLDLHPEAMLVGCRMAFIDNVGNPMSWSAPHFSTDRAIRRQLPFRSPLGHPSLMLRRDVLYEVGGYSTGLPVEDWELYLRLAQLPGRTFHSLDEVLFEHRRHVNQVTSAENIHANHRFAAAVLFASFLHTKSPRYVLGMLLRSPRLAIARRTLLRKLGRTH